MANVSLAIERYINQTLTLTQSDISRAVKSREWLLDRIESKINERSNEPTLYTPEKFVLFGSYIKGTKVENVDEFDVLVVIDSNTGIYSSGGHPIGDGLGSANPNAKYDSRYMKSDESGVSPRKLLNWLHGVVSEAVQPYGGTAPEKSGGQAIVATIDSLNLKIDLVPAGIFKRIADGTEFYNIPNGKQNNSWVVTSPKNDINRLKKAAEGRKNFRNIIRLCKRIKDCYNFSVSSFAIETAIINYSTDSNWIGDLYYDLIFCLRHISMSFKDKAIPDPYSPESNLISEVQSLEWYSQRLDDIIKGIHEVAEVESQSDADELVYELMENLR
jgi:hypothetical protein